MSCHAKRLFGSAKDWQESSLANPWGAKSQEQVSTTALINGKTDSATYTKTLIRTGKD